MFKNFINIFDFYRILEKVKQGKLKGVFKRIFRNSKNRVKDSWKSIETPPINYWDIPAISERFNKLISGKININHRLYIKRKYLNSLSGLIGLSLGCGSGLNEIEWAELGIFRRIDAFDISESRIEFAISEAKKRRCTDIVKFSTADILQRDLGKLKYDMVILEGSLHHFTPVKEILLKINSSLKPNGYLVVKDFVGPNRFQWTQRQMEITNAILLIMPERYKKKWESSEYKTRVYRPSRLSMILSDPSEAAESEKILPFLKKIFDVVELKNIGGTILQLLFSGIAHNFISDDQETRRLLKLCFNIEDTLMSLNEISSDLILAICKRKQTDDMKF